MPERYLESVPVDADGPRVGQKRQALTDDRRWRSRVNSDVGPTAWVLLLHSLCGRSSEWSEEEYIAWRTNRNNRAHHGRRHRLDSMTSARRSRAATRRRRRRPASFGTSATGRGFLPVVSGPLCSNAVRGGPVCNNRSAPGSAAGHSIERGSRGNCNEFAESASGHPKEEYCQWWCWPCGQDSQPQPECHRRRGSRHEAGGGGQRF